jgi:predicted transcriptional regulator of viral defense system
LRDAEPVQVKRRKGLIAEGFSDAELHRRVRAGDLVALRRGSYLPRADVPSSAVARHALQVRATQPCLAPDAVVSHASAAALFDLPLWAVPLGRVRVTRRRRHGGHRSETLHVHSAGLDAGETVLIGGIPVTSVARTVADLARPCRSRPRWSSLTPHSVAFW